MSSIKALSTENQSLKSRIARIRSSAKEAGAQIQSTGMRIAGGAAASYATVKFGKDGKPLTVMGLPGPLALGIAMVGVGMLSDSDPIRELGEGALVVAAADFAAGIARAP